MSERGKSKLERLKHAFEAARGSSLTDADIVGILKGETPIDRPMATALAAIDMAAVIEIGKATRIEFARINETYVTAIGIDGEATSEELADHPEVVRRKSGPVWPPDKPFPLTPLEAWYVMRGWEVAPAAGITMQQIIEEFPGKIEGGAGWLKLWEP